MFKESEPESSKQTNSNTNSNAKINRVFTNQELEDFIDENPDIIFEGEIQKSPKKKKPGVLKSIINYMNPFKKCSG